MWSIINHHISPLCVMLYGGDVYFSHSNDDAVSTNSLPYSSTLKPAAVSPGNPLPRSNEVLRLLPTLLGSVQPFRSTIYHSCVFSCLLGLIHNLLQGTSNRERNRLLVLKYTGAESFWTNLHRHSFPKPGRSLQGTEWRIYVKSEFISTNWWEERNVTVFLPSLKI